MLKMSKSNLAESLKKNKSKMFYHIVMEHDIILHPRYFGCELFKRIKEKLHNDVEGSCNGRYGFVIAITAVDEIGPGFLIPSEGFVKYHILFKGIVFRPFKGEILDGIVSQINKVGIFVEVGPLSCFISRLSMPLDLKFCDMGNEMYYRTKDEEMIIGVDSKVRLKLLGTRIEAGGIFGVGSIIDDYLGLISP